MEARINEKNDILCDRVAHFSLDLLHDGDLSLYIWRYRPDAESERRILLLVDLCDIYLPNIEIEKMIAGFETPKDSVHAIAFTNCNTHNQREIKRKLKVMNLRLYSNTAFFPDSAEAELWLSSHTVNC